MTDFRGQDLADAQFEEVDLSRAQFRDVSLRDASFHWVDLSGVRISAARLVDVDITGDVSDLRVNGVDVAPLVEAELDRRHPGRAKMRATTVAEFREAWDLLQFGVRSCGPEIWTVLLTGVAGGLLALITPIFTGILFDTVIPGAQRKQLLQLMEPSR